MNWKGGLAKKRRSFSIISISFRKKEISSTKRRVNALHHIIIPRLVNTARFIDLALEEEDREKTVTYVTPFTDGEEDILEDILGPGELFLLRKRAQKCNL